MKTLQVQPAGWVERSDHIVDHPVEINLRKNPPRDLAKEIAVLFQDLQPLIVWLREALR